MSVRFTLVVALATCIAGCTTTAVGEGGSTASSSSASASSSTGVIECDTAEDCHDPAMTCLHGDGLCGEGAKGKCHVKQCPCSETCSAQPVKVCTCGGTAFGPSCTLVDHWGDPSHCSTQSFPCGPDLACKEYLEYCAMGAHPACVPAPPGCGGLADCACLGLSIGFGCDEAPGVTIECPYAAKPPDTCSSVGDCALQLPIVPTTAPSPVLWPAGTACTRCGQDGTCDGVGSCSASASACGSSAACWGNACVTLTAVHARWRRSCAVTSAGGVWCWGPIEPESVPGLESGVADISLGGSHLCALTSGGGLKCWGEDSLGQLGDGETSTSDAPVDVTGLSTGVASVSAGYSNTCAVTTTGGALCWGQGLYGQVGDGTTNGSSVPVVVTGLSSGVAAVAAGYQHSCALTTAGAVKCWGDNAHGQLGDNSTVQRNAPVGVVGLSSGVVSVAVGMLDSCALTSAGAVKCWGFRSLALGDGSLTDSLVPVDVVGLPSGVAAIAAGIYSRCALTNAGAVWCWGHGEPAAAVADLSSGVIAITAGEGHVCALRSNGSAVCWGRNAEGQLGNKTLVDSATPVAVLPP